MLKGGRQADGRGWGIAASNDLTSLYGPLFENNNELMGIIAVCLTEVDTSVIGPCNISKPLLVELRLLEVFAKGCCHTARIRLPLRLQLRPLQHSGNIRELLYLIAHCDYVLLWFLNLCR